jgi:DNA-binding transcriptional LysR family regulator
MELSQLRMFAMAAELQSFTRAAEAMFVTQPAVSQQVAMLEHELGVSLFQRSGRGVVLTPAGRNMYDYTRSALELLDAARHEIGVTPDVVSGTVHVASCTIPSEIFLPGLLADFRRAYPQIRQSVTVSGAAEAARAVETGNADLAFIVVQPPGDHLSTTMIACHVLVLVVSPEHRLAQCHLVTADQLRDEPFVMREAGSGTRQCIEQALMDIGISRNTLTIALETNSDSTIRGAVKQGVGLAFLSPTTIQDDIDHGRLVAVATDVHVRINIYLVSDPQHVPTPAVRAFLTFINSIDPLTIALD